MEDIPTPEKCIKLLREYGCSESVISHSKSVRDVALIIAKQSNADIKLVETGALLHDIGRSQTHGIRHGIEGAQILGNRGISEKIIKIIERHIGAGLDIKNAEKLGLPPKEYLPITLEEKIVCHADNLIDNCKIQKIDIEINKAYKKGQIDYAKRLIKLHRDLSEICGEDLNQLLFEKHQKKINMKSRI